MSTNSTSDSFSKPDAGEFLFVYGSLRRGNSNKFSKLLETHGRFCEEGYMLGRLFKIDWYPGATESTNPNERVYGDLYQLHRPIKLLQILDEYEECSLKFPRPHEYIRRKVRIFLKDNRNVMAWVYLFNHKTRNLKRIPTGIFLC